MGDQGEVRDGMRIEWDVALPMDDGVVLRADVFRPPDDGTYPALVTYGPYGKGLRFQDGYPDAWDRLVAAHPEVAEGTSARYTAWETPDPEHWVPDGYAVVRIDARGWGRSPGYIDPYAMRGSRDFHDCIEWAGTQPWSSGKVGLLGISYFAIDQWLVAGLQPPHLTAMIPWEGLADFYRDMYYHGGIMCTAVDVWYRRTISTVQHGLGDRSTRSPNTGELVTGPETLTDEELALHRANYPGDVRGHRLLDGFHQERSARWDSITVPFLAAGNWGGQGRHLRGATEAFVRARSPQKWLELHGGEHWAEFYTAYGVGLQKAFFAHFLQGADNGWDRRPPVHLRVRTLDGFVDRDEDEWPLARTRWTRLHLDLAEAALVEEPSTESRCESFDALGSGLTFVAPPTDTELELTGPISARLSVSSSTTDADLFLVVRVFAPDGSEVVFQGAVDPHTPVAQGWLRVSHRELDPELSRPYRPVHTHRGRQPMTPGEVYEVEVEIWPTSVVVPAGHRVALTVRGKDYEYEGAEQEASLGHFKGSVMRGCGIYLHDDPDDRPTEIYGGTTTLHVGPQHPASLLLPVIPPA